MLPFHINTVKSQQQKRLGFNSAPLPGGQGTGCCASPTPSGLLHLLPESARSSTQLCAPAAGQLGGCHPAERLGLPCTRPSLRAYPGGHGVPSTPGCPCPPSGSSLAGFAFPKGNRRWERISDAPRRLPACLPACPAAQGTRPRFPPGTRAAGALCPRSQPQPSPW